MPMNENTLLHLVAAVAIPKVREKRKSGLISLVQGLVSMPNCNEGYTEFIFMKQEGWGG